MICIYDKCTEIFHCSFVDIAVFLQYNKTKTTKTKKVGAVVCLNITANNTMK